MYSFQLIKRYINRCSLGKYTGASITDVRCCIATTQEGKPIRTLYSIFLQTSAPHALTTRSSLSHRDTTQCLCTIDAKATHTIFRGTCVMPTLHLLSVHHLVMHACRIHSRDRLKSPPPSNIFFSQGNSKSYFDVNMPYLFQ